MTAGTYCAAGVGRRWSGRRRITLAGDKGHDTGDFVAGLRAMRVTPHTAPQRDRWSHDPPSDRRREQAEAGSGSWSSKATV